MNTNTVNEKVARIRDLITEITGGNRGIVIYLKNVAYTESYRSTIGSSSISISCIFMNDNEAVCADLYRTGNGGLFDFICGKAIDDLSSRGLDDIAYALSSGNWSVSEQVKSHKHKKVKSRTSIISLRMPFHLKGA